MGHSALEGDSAVLISYVLFSNEMRKVFDNHLQRAEAARQLIALR